MGQFAVTYIAEAEGVNTYVIIISTLDRESVSLGELRLWQLCFLSGKDSGGDMIIIAGTVIQCQRLLQGPYHFPWL